MVYPFTTNESPSSYGTEAEIAFLDQIKKSPNARLLLSNYLAAGEKRTVWNGIDKEAVLLYAGLLLGNLESAAKTERRVARTR